MMSFISSGFTTGNKYGTAFCHIEHGCLAASKGKILIPQRQFCENKGSTND